MKLQEGHTAHATRDEALAYARSQLDMYVSVCEELLAVPVIKVRLNLTLPYQFAFRAPVNQSTVFHLCAPPLLDHRMFFFIDRV
jgi:hypothetical protein